MNFSSRNALPGAAILLLFASLAPPRAHACSIALSYFDFLSPMSNDIDVPTNAAIFVHGAATISADAIELVDADGAPVPIETRGVGPRGMEVTPSDELLPNHVYTLWARYIVEDDEWSPGVMQHSRDRSISFTTGPGPASVPAQLDAPAIDVQVLQYGLDSCGLRTGLCVEAARPPDTTLEILVDGDVVGAGSRDPWPRYTRPLAFRDCIEVRVRDVRGNRSEPSLACGEQLQRPALRSDTPDAEYTCDNYEQFLDPTVSGGSSEIARAASVSSWSSSAGCGLVPFAAAPGRLAGLVSILVALLTLARRRTQTI